MEMDPLKPPLPFWQVGQHQLFPDQYSWSRPTVSLLPPFLFFCVPSSVYIQPATFLNLHPLSARSHCQPPPLSRICVCLYYSNSSVLVKNILVLRRSIVFPLVHINHRHHLSIVHRILYLPSTMPLVCPKYPDCLLPSPPSALPPAYLISISHCLLCPWHLLIHNCMRIFLFWCRETITRLRNTLPPPVPQ